MAPRINGPGRRARPGPEAARSAVDCALARAATGVCKRCQSWSWAGGWRRLGPAQPEAARGERAIWRGKKKRESDVIPYVSVC